MKSIDVKSLIIGILGTALVMTLMGLSFTKDGTYRTARCSPKWDLSGWTSKDEDGKRVCKYLLVIDVASL